MTAEEILKRLQDIFVEVFDDDTIELKPTTTAEDVEDWDSITHVELIASIESSFKLRFSTQELGNLSCVGDMCALLAKKQSA